MRADVAFRMRRGLTDVNTTVESTIFLILAEQETIKNLI